jgi:hypothetical protein
MSEQLLAQIVSGFFGLASMALGAYLPRRGERKRTRAHKKVVTATEQDTAQGTAP